MPAARKFAPSKDHKFDGLVPEGYYYISNPFFKWEKLRCQHTGIYHMQEEFLHRLIKLRREFGKPMVISSGFRDRFHPLEKDKTRKGAHVFGRGALICGNHLALNS